MGVGGVIVNHTAESGSCQAPLCCEATGGILPAHNHHRDTR